MNCDWVAEHIDEHVLGALSGAESRWLEEHLAACARCRALLARVRSADEAIRSALAWVEPSPAFARQVAARARRPARRGWVVAAAAVAVAAAALALAWSAWRRERDERPAPIVVAPQPGPAPQAPVLSGRLVAGELRDAYGLAAQRVVRGRAYVAADHSAIGVGADSLFVFARGSEFAPAPSPRESSLAVSMLAGSVLGQVKARAGEMAIELAPELGGALVRTRGCEFYSTGFPAERLAANMAFPAGALGHWPEDIRIHVLAGKLTLDLGSQRLDLSAGDSAIISGGVSAGTTRALEDRTRELRVALGDDVLATRALYEQLCDGYAHRLLELRSGPEAQAPTYLGQRIEFVSDLLERHSEGLLRLEAEHPELLELDAAEAELLRLELLRDEAEGAMERIVVRTVAGG